MKTQTRKDALKLSKRNPDLENTVGNLLVANFQVEKLKKKLIELQTWVDNDTPLDNATSTFPFVHEGRLYKIHLILEKPDEE